MSKVGKLTKILSDFFFFGSTVKKENLNWGGEKGHFIANFFAECWNS